MKISYAILTAIPLIAGAALLQSPSSSVKAHCDKLLASKSLTSKCTVQIVGGASFEKSIVLAKPNRIRIESPSQLIVSDGTTVWKLNKKTNEYIEGPAPGEPGKLLEGEGILYLAFFDPKFMESVGSSKAGKVRKIKGFTVREVEVTLPKIPGASATLLIDDTIGIARGMVWKETTPQAMEMVVFAEELALDKADDKLFAFVAPEGAKKLEAPATGNSDAPTWSQISAIFMGNCTGCHGGRMARGGLNLSTYESTMAGSKSGKVIVAGDVNASRIMQYLYGRGRPQMPPSGKMPDSVIQKIEKWIAAGAQKS